MGFFEPAWKSEDKNTRRDAMHRMTEDRALSIIQKISDQEILADFALISRNKYNEFPTEVHKAALGKITDKKLISFIADNSPYIETTALAADKLADRPFVNYLYRLFTGSTEVEFERGVEVVNRLKVLEKPTMPELYAAFAKVGEEDFGMEAIDNLTDEALLADVAKNGNVARVCIAAAEKLTNPDTIREVYLAMQPTLAKYVISYFPAGTVKYPSLGSHEDVARDIEKLRAKFEKKKGIIEKITDCTVLNQIIKGKEINYVYFIEERVNTRIDSEHIHSHSNYLKLDLRQVARERLAQLSG
ncbi:MAG: hypothetical protein FWB96_05250 [Defluviitaleaceae bacterium]|nr:hypothetical protein [Defluviitaleaceae bacterium]MCL2263609.1 hypothetical protein [Defluviitaleaceae bacterium]